MRDISELPVVLGEIAGLEAVLNRITQRLAETAGESLEQTAKRNSVSYLKRGTGALQNSINVRTNTIGSRTSARLEFLFYGQVHDQGMVIQAKNGGYLTFKGSFGWRKVRSVTIPKRPWATDAVESTGTRFPASVIAAFEIAASKAVQ